MERISVKNFVEDFLNKKIMNSKVTPNAVEDYIKDILKIKNYIPFIEKRELCEKVLNACNHIDENGLVKVDSVSRYIVFTITILSKYTELEFSSGDGDMDSIDEYDMLCRNNLLDPILELIGNEYAVCNNLLNMMMEDIIANNNTIENVAGHVLNKLSNNIGEFIDVLAKKVDSLNLDLDQIDIDKYKGLIDTFAQK